MMKQLLIKIIKNPKRACFALCRRMRVLVKKFYFWFCYKYDLIPYISSINRNFHTSLTPASLKHYDQDTVAHACHALNIYGDFFGVQINDPLPPWNEDVRLRNINKPSRFFPYDWYSKIKISMHEDTDLGQDIKVPWMLGRLNHVTLWTYAYYHTHDEQFLKKCIVHLEDFIEKNPPYYGVQWTCAMEVALRAINIILTISLLNEKIPTMLKKKVISALRYQEWYLYNHWEFYDGKTNNHYLSNLVGYWYLSSFFNTDKREWCAQQLIQEVEKQLLDDGTFYEGSTAYHRLSTDLIVVALAIDEDNLLFSLNEKYKKMEQLCSVFQYNENDMILIGDNDSSPVLHPHILNLMRQKQSQIQGIFDLKDFGLDVFKSDSLHVTLRHHVYNQRQPNGHFHDDCNALTIAINNKLCIVDPGTYVYTSSLPWRQALRASAAHGTCFLQDEKKYGDCFSNSIKEKKYNGSYYSDHRQTIFASSCNCQNFAHERFIAINANERRMVLNDYIRADKRDVIWQLPIRGNIIRSTNNMIEFDTDGVIWQLHMQQKWCIQESWYAPSYGKLEPMNYVLINGVQGRIKTLITWH